MEGNFLTDLLSSIFGTESQGQQGTQVPYRPTEQEQQPDLSAPTQPLSTGGAPSYEEFVSNFNRLQRNEGRAPSQAYYEKWKAQMGFSPAPQHLSMGGPFRDSYYPLQPTKGFRHGGKHSVDPSEIIFHHTGGPTAQGALDALRQRGLSYNYIIDRDGKLINLVDPGYKAFHAKGHNKGTIGVSFVGGGQYGDVTPEQHKAAIELSSSLQKQFPGLKGFAGHKHRTSAGKPDPSGFDFEDFARKSGLSFTPDYHRRGY